MKRALVSAVIALFVVSGGMAHCWEDYPSGPEITTIDGKVSEVDLQRSRITIQGVNKLTFYVPVSARIVQDIYDMKLSGIKVGDYVTVDYYDDPPGKHQARTITVHYEEGEGI